VGWGYSCFFFFFLPLSAEVSVEVAAESDVAVVSGVVAVGVVAVSGAGVAAGAVAVDGSVVGAGMVVDGVVCGVVGVGVVWAFARGRIRRHAASEDRSAPPRANLKLEVLGMRNSTPKPAFWFR